MDGTTESTASEKNDITIPAHWLASNKTGHVSTKQQHIYWQAESATTEYEYLTTIDLSVLVQ